MPQYIYNILNPENIPRVVACCNNCQPSSDTSERLFLQYLPEQKMYTDFSRYTWLLKHLHRFPRGLPAGLFLYIPHQPPLSLSAVPILHIYFWYFYKGPISYLEKSPHRRSSLLLSLQFLLSFGVPLRLVIGYHFFLQMTRWILTFRNKYQRSSLQSVPHIHFRNRPFPQE